MFDLFNEFRSLVAALDRNQIDYALTPQIQGIWDRRVKAEWQDGTISVVSREGLIALKLLRNSVQDQADIAVLEGKLEDGTS